MLSQCFTAVIKSRGNELLHLAKTIYSELLQFYTTIFAKNFSIGVFLMIINKSHNRLPCLLLAFSCLASTQTYALTQEDVTDKLLIDCTFKPRDATIAANGTYQRAYVSGNTSPLSGSTDDLRLYQATTTSGVARQRFSMIWKSFDSTNGNQWYITPDYAGKCIIGKNGYPHAQACEEDNQRYLTMNDGYYVISGNSNKSSSWRAPANADSQDYLTMATFNASDSLSVRRRFHWEIRDCKNLLNQFKSPAP